MDSSIDLTQPDIKRIEFASPEKSYQYKRRYDTLVPDSKRSDISNTSDISSSRRRHIRNGSYGQAMNAYRSSRYIEDKGSKSVTPSKSLKRYGTKLLEKTSRIQRNDKSVVNKLLHHEA